MLVLARAWVALQQSHRKPDISQSSWERLWITETRLNVLTQHRLVLACAWFPFNNYTGSGYFLERYRFLFMDQYHYAGFAYSIIPLTFI